MNIIIAAHTHRERKNPASNKKRACSFFFPAPEVGKGYKIKKEEEEENSTRSRAFALFFGSFRFCFASSGCIFKTCRVFVCNHRRCEPRKRALARARARKERRKKKTRREKEIQNKKERSRALCVRALFRLSGYSQQHHQDAPSHKFDTKFIGIFDIIADASREK